MKDFNEYFTYMIIELQKEAFDNPAKADELEKSDAANVFKFVNKEEASC